MLTKIIKPLGFEPAPFPHVNVVSQVGIALQILGSYLDSNYNKSYLQKYFKGSNIAWPRKEY